MPRLHDRIRLLQSRLAKLNRALCNASERDVMLGAAAAEEAGDFFIDAFKGVATETPGA